jgi:hypothetical protein
LDVVSGTLLMQTNIFMIRNVSLFKIRFVRS